MDSDVFVDFLLDNSLFKTAQELIIELEAAGEQVPAKLIGFFGRADSNSVKSGESGLKEDAGHKLSSEQLALYDVLSQIAPESKVGPEEESKALLRYKLKLANEEIERLKSVQSEPGTCESVTTVINLHENSAPVDNLDQLVMKYLEERGLEYSASTLCDEANLDPSLNPHPTLVELVKSGSSENSAASSFLAEKKLKEKTLEVEKLKSDLRSAHQEIERFSQNLVDNMLTLDTPVLPTPTMPALSGSMKGSVVQVSDQIWKMIQQNANINSENMEYNKDTFIASDMPNLLGIIEDCIEPLLSGILLKHRPLLIPLLLSAAYLSQSPESNDVFLKRLFNLIKKPDEDQREIIARGCAAYSKFCGDSRCEAELFPQLWLQLEHKHPERRILVAKTAAVLALETGPKSHPLLLSICQQLLEDKNSDVRRAAADSFAVLLSFSEDADRMSSIQNSCVKIINDDSISSETALLVLSAVAKISFEAEKESNLVHKLLKIIETTQDSKRALKAVAEILPHFYAALALNSQFSGNCSGKPASSFYISKFNAVSNVYPEIAGFDEQQNWTISEEHGRFNVILKLLTKQIIPRLIDCALECPVMPDFCQIWTEIFATLSQLFGPSFIKTFVNPLMISELGLFTDSSDKSALQTTLVCCFCSGCIATLIDDKYMFEYFSMVLREIIFKITPLKMSGFEIAIESLLQRDQKSELVAKRVNEATMGVLWEGVTNQHEDIRIITARAITCAARKLSLTDISRQLFPALNSLCLDASHVIRKEASNCVAVVIHRTQLEKHDDLERRLQKIVMQLMVDQFSDVRTSVIKTLIPIALDSDQAYREDFFLPQVSMVVTNIMPASVDTSLVETILDLYDQLLSSNTAISNGCLKANIIPALESLEPICKSKVFHRIIQLQSLMRTSISRAERKQETNSIPMTTSKSAYSLSSVLRNPFSKK